MRNSVEILEILDSYLDSKKISRRQFCLDTNIPKSTIANWKTKPISPSGDLLYKVAKYMNVSVDWLINGEDPRTEISIVAFSRHTIMDRIETMLRQNEDSSQTPLAELYTEHLGEIASFDLINNWSLGRINVSETIITALAKKLNVTADWLLTGREETDQVIDTHLYKLAKEHEAILEDYDCLEEEDKKFVNSYIESKIELRRLQREAKLNQK